MSFSIPLASIDTAGRSRQDYGDLEGLASSLLRLGSIHPIVLSEIELPPIKNPDGSLFGVGAIKYKLIAGGRRMRAMKLAGFDSVYHGAVLEKNRPGFLFKSEVPEDELREAELDENLYRLNQKWQEDVLLISDIHALKIKKEGIGNWGQEQTGALYGVTKAHVSRSLKVAKLVRSGDKEVLACPNMDAVYALLIKRKEDEAIKRQQEFNKQKIAAGGFPTLGGGTDSFLDSFNIEGFEAKAKPIVVLPSIDGLPPIESAPIQPAQPSPQITVPLSKMFFCGPSVSTTLSRSEWILSSFSDSCVDHIVTDIPYGIDMDNLDLKGQADVAAEHEVEDNVAMMPLFLAEAFRLVRSGGFCVFFYDLDHHEKLQAMATDIGWKVQRWPLIWTKPYPCRNGAAAYNFTKNYEVAMVLRRDEKSVLRKAQPSSYFSVDARSERSLYNNPFAKPFELWKSIYDAIAFAGQSVLDPFCGEASACRAAANLGLNPFGVEIKEQHYNRGIEHMRKVFQLVHGPNTLFS